MVTVLTTAFDAERHLAQAVESVLAQTFEDFEYLIVDDCSQDATPEIVERYARRDDRVRYVRRDRQGGPYVAANEGFRQARGKYVARLDADDVCFPTRLERQLEFLSSHPDLRACASEVDLIEDDEVRPFTRKPPILPGSLKWRVCVREMPMPSTTFVEVAAWSAVGGFREQELSQDLRFWCDLARRHWLGIVHEPLVYWRVHPSQLSQTRRSLQESLAFDVLRDHLQELTGESWSLGDVALLRFLAYRPTSLRHGRSALTRFERLWRADPSLSPEERRELEELGRDLRSGHVQVWLRNKLESRSWGRAALRLRSGIVRLARS